VRQLVSGTVPDVTVTDGRVHVVVDSVELLEVLHVTWDR
jgi:hypothetical protein